MKKLFLLAAAVLFTAGMSAETYRLITDDGKINTKDFYTTITTVNSASETFTEADESSTTWGYNVTFGSSRSTAYGQASNLFEYNAKTTQTRVKIYTKADNSGRKVYFQQFVEGEVPAEAPANVDQTFNLGEKNALEIFSVSSDNAKARTLYFMGNNGSIKICQIVVEEIGEPLPQGGQVGYATLIKNGRWAIKSGVEGVVDGITYNVKSDIKPGNGGKGAVMRGADYYMKFTTTEAVVLKVKENNKKGYYLAQTKEDYDDTKAIKTGDAEIVLRTPGDWYIICNTSSDTQIDSIAFAAYVQSDDATLKAISVGENALDLSKFVENEGVLEYNCQLTMGTTEVPEVAYELNHAGASAVKTDAADVTGSTTIVVTAENGVATKTYKINFSVKSELGHDATLSDLKINGVTPADFAADKYAYNIEIGLYDAIPDVTAVANDDNADVSVSVNEQLETQILVQVIAEDGENAQTYTVDYSRAAATALAPISESTTWDWANAGSATAEQKAATLPSNEQPFNFADVLINPSEAFNAAALMGIAQFANRGSYFQGNQVSFQTTVAGKVVVTYSNTGGSRPYRHVEVNGTLSAEGSANQDMKETEAFDVEAGDVVIKFYIPDAENPQARDGDNVGYAMGRISKIVFTANGGGTALGNTEAEVKAVKRIVNGQLLIEKNGVLYNAQGAIVK